MRKLIPAACLMLALLASAPASAQVPNANRNAATPDADATYGRVKEMTTQKVVIDVDNAPDKTYDLTDKNWTVNLARQLKVGDPVRITEHDVNGKKMVDVAMDNSPEKHGDKTREQETKK